MYKVLTIAGSDSSGGAGIQADIKTIAAHDMYAMSVITALTAQNTTGVYGIFETTADFTKMQIDAVFTDIAPDAVKIGMVSNAEIIKVIAERLRYYNAKNIVVDPVMVSTSGGKLMMDGAAETLTNELFPLAAVVTPNLRESEALCGFSISNRDEMIRAADMIGSRYGCAVLIKGGHASGGASDLLYSGGENHWFEGVRIDNPNTHGTGCTLSSAIACRLAEGRSLEEAIRLAKEYLTGAISVMLDLGAGSGPLDHGYVHHSSRLAGVSSDSGELINE